MHYDAEIQKNWKKSVDRHCHCNNNNNNNNNNVIYHINIQKLCTFRRSAFVCIGYLPKQNYRTGCYCGEATEFLHIMYINFSLQRFSILSIPMPL
jgi:hypothetical protein